MIDKTAVYDYYCIYLQIVAGKNPRLAFCTSLKVGLNGYHSFQTKSSVWENSLISKKLKLTKFTLKICQTFF